MDIIEESSVLIQFSNGNVLRFQECHDVLYYYNMVQGSDSKNTKTKYKSLITNYFPNPSSQFLATVK